jgi:hypothetical protein
MIPKPLPDLSRADLLALLAEAENRSGIRAHMIEKDAWVCWTLRQLFALPDAHGHFIFKGGTSLSKIWKVIQRFSEDIDVSLRREWLGFVGERDPESAPSRKQRTKLLDELSATCAAKLCDEVLPALRQRFTETLGASGWTLTVADEDPQTLLFAYPSAYSLESGAPYVRPLVRIECGARSDRWPVAEHPIASYLTETFPDLFPSAPFTVPVLEAERTFWEKATILHAEAHRPADKATPDRFSRHYADLAALAAHPVGEAALSRDDLRARVVVHKQVFFPAAWAAYESAVPGTFKLIPPAPRLDALAADYRAMQDMFFRPPPSWEQIVANLRQLETRINAPAGSRTA